MEQRQIDEAVAQQVNTPDEFVQLENRILALNERRKALLSELHVLRETADNSFWQETGVSPDDSICIPEGGHNYNGPFRAHWDSGTVSIGQGYVFSGLGFVSVPGQVFTGLQFATGGIVYVESWVNPTTGAVSATFERTNNVSALDATDCCRTIIGEATLSGTEITHWEQHWQGSDIYVPTYRIPESHSGVSTTYEMSWYIRSLYDY